MAGYEIKYKNSYCIEYSEGDHKMDITIDYREPVPDFSFEEVNQWKPPYEEEKISKDKKLEILSNISRYLQKEGYEKIYIHGYGYLE